MSKCLSGYFQSDQFSQRLQASRVALWMSKCQPRLGLEMIQEQTCLPQSPSARPSTPLRLTSPAKTNLLSTGMLSCLVCSSNCRERTMRAFQGQKIYRHDFDQKLTRLYLVVGNTRENSMKFEYVSNGYNHKIQRSKNEMTDFHLRRSCFEDKWKFWSSFEFFCPR